MLHDYWRVLLRDRSDFTSARQMAARREPRSLKSVALGSRVLPIVGFQYLWLSTGPHEGRLSSERIVLCIVIALTIFLWHP